MSMTLRTPDAAAEPAWRSVAWAVLNAVQFGFTCAWTAGGIVLALLLQAFTGNTALALRMAARCWAPGLITGAGGRLRVEGADAIDWSQPYLLVSNHQSVIDICALFAAVPKPLRFLLKQEMTGWPMVGWYAVRTGMLFIDRDNPRAAPAMLRAATVLLADGHSLCVFPEGTRSRTGELAEFKAGPFTAAIKAEVAVLPVAVHGAGAVLPPDSLFRVRPGTIRLRFGTPIPAETVRGLDRQQLAQLAQARVQAMLEQP